MDQDFAEGLEVHPTSDEKSRALGEESEMATDLSSGPFEGRGLITSEFLTPVAEAPPADEDDDVLFVEPLAKTSVSVAVPGTTTSSSTSMAPVDNLNQPEVDKLQTTVKDLSPPLDALAETIIIDDEEDAESGTVLPEKSVSPVLNKDSDLDPSKVEDTSSSSNKVLASSHSHIDTPVTHSTISTEPDSEIRIANVTTLDDGDTTLRNSSREPVHQSHSNEGAMDMNLMITSVTSLQSNSLGEVTNGPQISSAFSLIPEVQTAPTASNSDSSRQGTQSGAGTFNPGRMNAAGEVVQNGELRSHQRSGNAVVIITVDTQTAVIRDITSMKGTIVAQVDSSESFQEFCSTTCLSSYENKQVLPKSTVKTRCTVCGKLTESISVQSSTNGQTTRTPSGVQLKCNYCKTSFSLKPETLEWEAARCDCCKIQGNLTETVQWRAEIKHFCDQQCLLRFYCQQNEPNMSTQKGPENLCFEPEVKTEYVPIPVPVPVYVPVPVHLYSQSTPVPLTVPVPVPVPVFVPTTLDSAEKIVQTIDELKNKIPSNPLEADILAMAEVIAEADEKIDSDVTNHSPKSHGEGGVEDIKLSSPGDFCEPDLDLEMDFPKAVPPSTSEEIRNSEITLPPALCAEIEEKPHPQVKKKGSKRRAILSNGPQADNPDTSQNLFTLKSSYGVNAWKRWVLMTDSKEEQENTKSVRLKGDLLKHTAAELNYALSRFVCDIRRPNGESYEPDSIYYLCLAIQQHLCENGRKDNIFCDTYYQMFIQELNKILKGWKPSILPDGSVFSRIQEHHMWSSKMIGDHSPTVLLNTLVYFNTKYFGLRTVEQHLQLSFANVFKQLKNARTKERTVCIQFPSITEDKSEQTGNRKRKGRDDENDPDYEPEDMSSGNGSRCPIKDHDRHIYELYFSKW
ncbi:ZMYM2 protein, partial [Polypterus senegalus]